MNTTRDPEVVLGTWLDEGPAQLPTDTRQAILVGVRTFPRRPRRFTWPRIDWRPTFAALGGAAAVVLAVVLALGVLNQGGNVAASPTPSPSPTAMAASPRVFTEIAPGEYVDVPDWPLSARTSPPRVWTGTEIIVWGDGINGLAGDGAAFDLAKGTWRVIAEAPLSPRAEPAVAWTGTEMLVWGGRHQENTFFYDGAAYDPASDTWRSLPASPFFGKDPIMVWTGDEAVVLGVSGDSESAGEYLGVVAYDPATDTWRSLKSSPLSVYFRSGAWWTGDSIVVADVAYAPEFDTVARYDIAADEWTLLEVGSSAALVGLPDDDAAVGTFLNVPSEFGAPVRLIDTNADLLGELPAFPGEPGVFGDQIAAFGVWVGDEAVLEIWNEGSDYQLEQIWALNPITQTWRRLDTDTAFPRIDRSVLVADDLLLMWNRRTDVYRGTPRVCCVAPPGNGGSIYRIGLFTP
jgi:hypothetical protein